MNLIYSGIKSSGKQSVFILVGSEFPTKKEETKKINYFLGEKSKQTAGHFESSKPVIKSMFWFNLSPVYRHAREYLVNYIICTMQH